jgi:hypothetical protein
LNQFFLVNNRTICVFKVDQGTNKEVIMMTLTQMSAIASHAPHKHEQRGECGHEGIQIWQHHCYYSLPVSTYECSRTERVVPKGMGKGQSRFETDRPGGYRLLPTKRIKLRFSE